VTIHLRIDGWNIAIKPFVSKDVEVKLNEKSQVSHWPETGLPVIEVEK